MSDPRVDESSWQLAALVDASDEAIVITDTTGIVTAWNAGAERLYGYAADETIGQPITLILPPDKLDEEADLLRRVMQGERVRNLGRLRYRKNGSEVLVSLTMAPVRSDGGEIRGIVRITNDISRWHAAEIAARRLVAIVTSSEDAIVSKDLNGIVTSWNRAAEQMFGYAAEEIVGRSIRAIIPEDRQSEEDGVLASIRRGEKVDHFDTIRRRKDGSLIPVSLTISPVVAEDGTVIGASKIARDISDRRLAEAERERLLALAQQSARVTQTLNQVGTVVSSTLDRDTILQAVTDAATVATRAEFGAFFYNAIDAKSGETYQLYTLSGASKEAFAQFPHPRATALFGPTFRGEGIVRIGDVTTDPRYGLSPPYHGMPPGHLPVRSYLAVPVKSRSGDVLGGMFFGHGQPDVFTAEDERLVAGIANWASVALENARLYAEIQESSRLKDEFLATLSHELRTPLNALLGYARMIRSGVIAAEGQGRAVETIERNALSLSQIVEDILDVSRIITGKIRLNVQPVDLPSVVRAAVEAMLPAANAKGIKIESVLDPRAAPISGDPERLQQVAWNLMTNAVKFTPNGGRVQVRLARVESHVEIVVSDTGIGIRPDFLPHIFERFRQADAGTNRERGGLGLGLGIARQLVELHGGTIEASSEGTGTGSTFRIKLPLMIVHPQAHTGDRSHPLTPRSRPPGPIPNLHGIRVLAVDDDRDALDMVREILESTGAYVAVADSASSALEILEVIKPDVLVLDLGMPRMDGFELLSRIRHSENATVRDIPAAALTAFARSEDRTRTLRSGFQIHLAKPIDPAELMAATAALAKRTGQDAR